MDKKKLLALLIFLLLGFFMVTFANPSENNQAAGENSNNNSVNENSNTNNTNNSTRENTTNNADDTTRTTAQTNTARTNNTMTTNTTNDNASSSTNDNASSSTNDGNNQTSNENEIGNVEKNQYLVRFLDYNNNVLKAQNVYEEEDATADDITVSNYTLANITYTFSKWDKSYKNVVKNLDVKALYSIEKIYAKVLVNGEDKNTTIELIVNNDTKNKKDIVLTSNNIDDYIQDVTKLPTAQEGSKQKEIKLVYDEKEGYIIKINEEKIDYTVKALNGAKLSTNKVQDVTELKVNYNDKVEITHKTRLGYTFVNFIVSDERASTTYKKDTTITVGLSNIEVKAEYKKDTYKINYDLNGGTLKESNPETYDVDSEFELNNPEKEGYEFLGWVENENDTPNKNYKIKNTTGNKNLKAIYKANKVEYKVIGYFENLPTSENTNKKVTKTFKADSDSKVDIEINKVFTSDELKGFDLDKSNSKEKYEGVVISPKGTTTIEVYFNRHEYNVTFTYHNGTKTEKVKYEASALAVAPNSNASVEYQEGDYTYSFTGNWLSKADLSTVTQDITDATAEYSQELTKYIISYDLDGGHEVKGKENPKTYTKDTPTFELKEPEKTGYTFKGWTGTGLNKVTKKVEIKKGSKGAKSFKAVWEAKKNIKYTVIATEEQLDGTYKTVATKEFNNGEADKEKRNISSPLNKASKGFTLEGPSKRNVTIKADGTTVVEFRYNRNVHKAHFYVNGVEYKPEDYNNEFKYGQTIKSPTYNIEEGYELTGWNDTTVMGDSDVNFYGTYKLKTFEITWVIPGKTNTKTTVEYGKKVGSAPSNATYRETEVGYVHNYKLIGWFDENGASYDENTIIKGSKTYTAKFAALKATINDNKQLAYNLSSTKNNKLINDDITVYLEFTDKTIGKNGIIELDNYTTDFDDTKEVIGKVLTITATYNNVTFENKKLVYEVDVKAYNTKFAVKFNSTGIMKQTKTGWFGARNCEKNCDESPNVEYVDYHHTFLEVIEHYNQAIEVQSVYIKFKDQENSVRTNLSDFKRYTAKKKKKFLFFTLSSSYSNPVYMASIRNEDIDLNNIESVTIKYYRHENKEEHEEAGTFNVTFKYSESKGFYCTSEKKA